MHVRAPAQRKCAARGARGRAADVPHPRQIADGDGDVVQPAKLQRQLGGGPRGAAGAGEGSCAGGQPAAQQGGQQLAAGHFAAAAVGQWALMKQLITYMHVARVKSSVAPLLASAAAHAPGAAHRVQ